MLTQFKFNKLKKATDTMDATKVKAKRKIRYTTSSVKFKALCAILGVLLMLVMVMTAGEVYHAWRLTYRWNMPIRFEPLIIEIKKPEIKSPLPKKAKVSMVTEVMGSEKNGVVTAGISLQDQIERMYDIVWFHESGRGTNLKGLNGFCISQGMINEIGYAVADNYCFKDRNEQHATFLLWVRNRLGTKCQTLDKCLALYNNSEYTLSY